MLGALGNGAWRCIFRNRGRMERDRRKALLKTLLDLVPPNWRHRVDQLTEIPRGHFYLLKVGGYRVSPGEEP